ncbi:MAG: GNAT family N-acetyltransferase [archaeon]|nr:GNAT family N-acetyltransferase [archaeon]
MWIKKMIKEIRDKKDLEKSVQIIRKSFLTVALQFNLTEKNAPSNPAYITFERLEQMKNENIKLFGLFHYEENEKKREIEEKKQIGFLAIEKADDSLYYLEKVAVLPEFRHRGYGKKILDFASDYVKKENGLKISVGMINENIILKNWYIKHSFVESSVKKFEHLPFTVCFLEKEIYY